MLFFFSNYTNRFPNILHFHRQPFTSNLLLHVQCTVCHFRSCRIYWNVFCMGSFYYYYYYYYPEVCLTTSPKPLPKRFLHIVRSKASSFKWEYPLLSLRSSSSFLRLLPRLLVTFISPFIFPSITCFRRQFLRKMWPIQSSPVI